MGPPQDPPRKNALPHPNLPGGSGLFHLGLGEQDENFRTPFPETHTSTPVKGSSLPSSDEMGGSAYSQARVKEGWDGACRTGQCSGEGPPQPSSSNLMALADSGAYPPVEAWGFQAKAPQCSSVPSRAGRQTPQELGNHNKLWETARPESYGSQAELQEKHQSLTSILACLLTQRFKGEFVAWGRFANSQLLGKVRNADVQICVL